MRLDALEPGFQGIQEACVSVFLLEVLINRERDLPMGLILREAGQGVFRRLGVFDCPTEIYAYSLDVKTDEERERLRIKREEGKHWFQNCSRKVVSII